MNRSIIRTSGTPPFHIAVIPGFQGVTAEGAVATLGRGGSDTSAVALAAAMNADRCDIYTDVDGVYTTDPRIVPRARKLDLVTYEEMLELASVGAKVLQTRSVGLAMRYNMPLKVLSSFEDVPGTMIVDDDILGEAPMERNVVTGIAHDRNEARVTLVGLPDRPGAVAAVSPQSCQPPRSSAGACCSTPSPSSEAPSRTRPAGRWYGSPPPSPSARSRRLCWGSASDACSTATAPVG